jgi:PAS domain S-box-containing protein
VPRLILRLAPLESIEATPARDDVLRLPDADHPGSAQTEPTAPIPQTQPTQPTDTTQSTPATPQREATEQSQSTAPTPSTQPAQPAQPSTQSGWFAATSSLRGWSAAVASSQDACFVLDSAGVVVSVSAAGIDLLGSGDKVAMGHHILDVIDLVDLESGASDPEYAPRITPLVVLRSPGLARSLMRVRHPDGAVVTLDSSSAPIHDESGQVLGSMTFISPIRAR